MNSWQTVGRRNFARSIDSDSSTVAISRRLRAPIPACLKCEGALQDTTPACGRSQNRPWREVRLEPAVQNRKRESIRRAWSPPTRESLVYGAVSVASSRRRVRKSRIAVRGARPIDWSYCVRHARERGVACSAFMTSARMRVRNGTESALMAGAPKGRPGSVQDQIPGNWVPA